MNAENNQSDARDAAVNKKGFFDPIEIKGLSAKSARAFSSGRSARILRSVSKLFAFTSSRVYGLMFLTFGVLTLFLHLGEYYFMDDPTVGVSSLVIGAVFTVLSIFFIISDKPICIALQTFRPIDFIVFDFFSINRMQHTGGERGFNVGVGIICGLLLSILGFFFPTEYAAFVIIGLLFIAVAMVSPEFPYIFSLLIFPYLSLIPYSQYLFAGLILLTVISFVRKVFVGKRIYSFEIYDFLFLFFALAVFITGVAFGSGESMKKAILILFFVIGYIPASNMTLNRRLFDCVSGALVASSIPVGLYSVIRYVIQLLFYERAPSRAFFDSPEILAVYLTTVGIFSLYLSFKRSRVIKKRYYFSAFILSLLALITTEYFAVAIAIVFLLLAFAVIRSERFPCFLLLALLVLPVLLFLLGDFLLGPLSEIFSIEPTLTDRRDSLWSSLCLFGENLFLGGEVGAQSYNVYAALACGFGIFAVIPFLMLLILRVFHLNVYKKYFSDSTVNFYVDMSVLALLAILILGSYADIFAQTEMIYFFVVVFATGSAALRVSKKEKEERQSYYKELGSSDSAAIDVTLQK